MIDTTSRKLLPLLYFLSWLPLVALLFPLPSMEQARQTGSLITKKMETSDVVGSKFRLMRAEVKAVYDFYSNPAELQKWMTMRWGMLTIILLGGLVASMFVLADSYYWKMAVISAAGCYLLYIFFQSGRYIPGGLDARSWLMMSTQLNGGFLELYKEFIFPVYQFILSIVVFRLFLEEHSGDNLEHNECGVTA